VWKAIGDATTSATRKRAPDRDDFMHAIRIITLQRTRALYQHDAEHDSVRAISFV
jgi:hypothetical protein